MKKLALSASFLLFLILCPVLSNAHFFWLRTKPVEEGLVRTEIYFGEIAEPDDPELLKKIKDVEGFTINAKGEKQPLKFSLANESLSTIFKYSNNPKAICVNHTYGLFGRGDNTFLLKYYAKTYTKGLADWSSYRTAKLNALDIVPSRNEDNFTFTVFWNEKPLVDAELKIYGDDLEEDLDVKTDQNGQYKCKLPLSGVYSIRTKQTENISGQYKDQKYDDVRHYSTLVLDFTNPVK